MRLVLGFLLAAACCAQTAPDDAFAWENRLQQYLYRTYSWQRMTLLALDTGIDHALQDPKSWGNGPGGFACRYSSSFGRRMVRNSMELGLGAVLDEDLRFIPSGTASMRARIRYAVVQAFTARRPDGSLEPAYGRFGATLGAAVVSSSWRPGGLSGSRTLECFGFSLLDHMQNSLLTEFSPDLRRFGVRVLNGIQRRYGPKAAWFRSSRQPVTRTP
jgi:hypothetical protein